MKQIVSIKIPANLLTFRRVLRLYERIQKSRSTAYLSVNKKTLPFNSLPKAIPFLLALKEKEVLLVIEGEDAWHLQHQIINAIRLAEENERINTGLHRVKSV